MLVPVEAKLRARQHQARIMEFGGDDIAGDLVDLLFIEKLEGVTAADFALEIDRKAHHSHIFGKRRFRNVAIGGGPVDRIVDHALGIGKVAFYRANGAEGDPAFFRIPYRIDVTAIPGCEGKPSRATRTSSPMGATG